MTDPRQRVLINTDAKNEADDQFAIVHALLSETLDVRGLIAAHFGDARSQTSMLDSREEIDLLLGYLDREDVRVENGAESAIPDDSTPIESPGARLIIDEAKKTDEGPLQIAFLGPLTDMASAILLDPSIVETDTTIIWIGGPGYGDLQSFSWPEFNLNNDIAAANVVFTSGMTIWQVPQPAYRTTAVGYAELDEKVAPYGPLGEYLVRQLKEWNSTWQSRAIEYRALGDSPAVGLMLNPDAGLFELVPAPTFGADGGMLPGHGNTVRVCHIYDARYLFEDFFAKLRRFAGRDELP